MKRHIFPILLIALAFAATTGVGELIIASRPTLTTTYIDASGREYQPSGLHRVIETFFGGITDSAVAALIVAALFWLASSVVCSPKRPLSFRYSVIIGVIGGVAVSCILWPFTRGSLPPGFLSFALAGGMAMRLAARYRLANYDAI